jgi:membrane fusion protein, heavy metal efflux system
VPPEFHAHAWEAGRPLGPDDFELDVALSRLGGAVDRFRFTPAGRFLRGDGVVSEPHSFAVTVVARHRGREHRWEFESYEGRTQIAPEIAAAAGIEVETAGPATLREEFELTGTIQARPERVARIEAPFPGVVREVRYGPGERVARGAVMARIESRDSLETYPVEAPLAGTVLDRHVQAGELTQGVLYTVADLSSVFAEIEAWGADVARLAAGQAVHVETVDGVTRGTGVVRQVAPVATRASQSVRARVELDNAAGQWRPGQFVRARVTVAEHAVPLAVRNEAVQRFRDHAVVFARVGDTYEVRMLETGRRDRDWTEVLDGLAPGTAYVTANSFLVKADIEKSGASHDH